MSAPSHPPLGVAQIHISVSDLARSLEFYRDQLGVPFLFEVPGQAMAFLQCGPTRLYLGIPESPQFRSRPVLYLEVADIQAAHAEMAERGAVFEDLPHCVHRTDTTELWMAFTRDPDGNAVAITQDRPAGAAGSADRHG